MTAYGREWCAMEMNPQVAIVTSDKILLFGDLGLA